MKVMKTAQKIPCPDLVGTLSSIQYPAIAEIKFDGEFNLLFVNQEAEPGTEKKTFLVNKNGKIRTECPIVEAAKKLPYSAIFVGELYHEEGKNNAIYKLNADPDSDTLKYTVFDIVEFDDKIVEDDLLERKELIASLLDPIGIEYTKIKVIESREMLEEYYKKVTQDGYEGLVIKNMKSRFMPGNCNWAKMKVKDLEDFEVSTIDPYDEKITVVVPANEGELISVGVKCINRIKANIAVGERVVIEFQGKTDSGSLRNPVLKGKMKDGVITLL